jgi:hypothetical protein
MLSWIHQVLNYDSLGRFGNFISIEAINRDEVFALP